MKEMAEALVTILVGVAGAFLMLLGAVFFLLGLAGGVTYHDWLPIAGTERAFAACALGVVVLAVGVIVHLRRNSRTFPNPKKFGFEITNPAEHDLVDKVDIRGTFKKEPPAGYSLRLLRVWPDGGIFPLSSPQLDTNTKKWASSGCEIWGNPHDKRTIEVCLVGPDGKILLDSYQAASATHWRVQDRLQGATGNYSDWLPPIRGRTADMISCARVTVIRKP